MKRISIVAVALSLMLVSCNGQIKNEAKIDNNDTILPKEDIKVNKEYDEEGNLVKFDSTYTSFYSNIENDSIKADSIFKSFKNFFNLTYPFSNQFYFNNLFFQDSLLHYDFYKDNFFRNRFRKNMPMMNNLFEDMDSIKNNFYHKEDQKNKLKKEE